MEIPSLTEGEGCGGLRKLSGLPQISDDTLKEKVEAGTGLPIPGNEQKLDHQRHPRVLPFPGLS